MKNKEKLLLTLSILFIPFSVKALNINTIGDYNYGGNGTEIINDVISLEDGGTIGVGYYDSNDTMENLGYEDAVIVKSDKDGKIEWIKNYGGDDDESFESIALTKDGGFIVVGNSISTNIEGMDSFDTFAGIIVKYNSNGEIEWQKSYDKDVADFFNSVVVLEDGSFVVVGYTSSTNITGVLEDSLFNALIVKYDKDGNIVWEKVYGGTGDDVFDTVLLTPEGEFLIIGNSDSSDIESITNKGSTDAIIVKYDKDGNIIWQKNWGGNDYDYFHSVVGTNDEGFIVVGNTISSDIEGISNDELNSKAIFIKYDKTGNIVYQKQYTGNNNHSFSKIIPVMGEKFLVVGNTDSTNIQNIPNMGDSDALAVMYDKTGNIVWQSTFGGNGYDEFTTATIAENGLLTLLGNYDSDDISEMNNNGLEDIMMIKYDIEFDLKTTETKNGNYTINKEGTVGKINPTPEKGYEVDKIIVKDSYGNIVNAVMQQDGTYSFPLIDDVIVEVIFKKELTNPQTGLPNMMVIMFIGIILSFMGYFYTRKFSNYYEA